MLKHSFIHMLGVSEAREFAIWKTGIRTWQDFVAASSCKYPWFKQLSPQVEESVRRLEEDDVWFFYSNLPGTHRWRLYNEFRKNCAFLDIETTGLVPPRDKITVAGIYDGKALKTFIQGKNLDELLPEMKKHPLIVTYGGSCFDLPFIRKQFRVVDLCDAHIDLRYVLYRLGYKGGLKRIENRFHMTREGPIQKVDGWTATLLWKEFKRGNAKALDALIRYNAEDVVNLQLLMEKAYSMQLRKLPIRVTQLKTRDLTCDLPEYDPIFLARFLENHFW